MRLISIAAPMWINRFNVLRGRLKEILQEPLRPFCQCRSADEGAGGILHFVFAVRIIDRGGRLDVE